MITGKPVAIGRRNVLVGHYTRHGIHSLGNNFFALVVDSDLYHAVFLQTHARWGEGKLPDQFGRGNAGLEQLTSASSLQSGNTYGATLLRSTPAARIGRSDNFSYRLQAAMSSQRNPVVTDQRG